MPDPSRLLISGGSVFDGVSDVVRRADVLIEGDRIAAVGPQIEATAERFDAGGLWITPGLIDMHVHLWNLGMEVLPALVGCGVTTVRDLGTAWSMGTLGVGGDARTVRRIQADIEAGKVVGPTVVYSGPMLHQMQPQMQGSPAMRAAIERASGDAGSKPLESVAEAREVVGRLIDEDGAGSIKIYESVEEPIAAAILEAAAGRAPVTGHLGLTSSKFAMERGIGGVEHLHQSLIRDIAPQGQRIDPRDWLGVPGYTLTVLRAWAAVDPDGAEVESWLQTLLDTGAFVDPTITINAARPGADDARRALFPTAFAAASTMEAPGPDPLAGASRNEFESARANQRAITRMIIEAGGPVLVGTDLLPGALPGWGYHAEMLALERRGMRPTDVLRAGTSLAASYLWREDLGRVEVGARADLALFARDPTETVSNVESIRQVVKGGVLHESARLLALSGGGAGSGC
ncbi:MAG TPA: amidohydrolase family protein [Dehalococcoidia bacterium]|nr:amidohydrolase family protein [Dehalococcoidia bacterium]